MRMVRGRPSNPSWAFAQGDEADALEHSQMEGNAAAIVEAKIAIGHP